MLSEERVHHPLHYESAPVLSSSAIIGMFIGFFIHIVRPQGCAVMSEMEVRPGLLGLIRSIIIERTFMEPSTRGIELYAVPSIELSPIKIVDDGKIYGLRVVCFRDALKDVFNYLLSSSEPYLMESYVFSTEEPAIAIFLLNTTSDEGLWKIVKKLSDINGVEFIEIHGPAKSMENVFTNHWLFPPSLMGDKLVIIPRSIIRDIIEEMDYDSIKNKIREFISFIKIFIGDRKTDLDVVIEFIHVLGLGDISSVKISKNSLKLEIKEPKACKNLCLLYLELINGLLNLNLSLKEYSDVSCVFDMKK